MQHVFLVLVPATSLLGQKLFWNGNGLRLFANEGGRIRDRAMSAWFRDDATRFLLEGAVQIALNYVQRAGEIDDYTETCRFLVERVEFMIRQGHRNRLLLANRAISQFQRYRRARTIELSLMSG
jgi:hypothetical protein